MANDAPTNWVNVTDTHITSNQYRPFPTWLVWRMIRAARWMYEKIARGDHYAGETRQNYPHAHGEQSTQCGEPVLRTVYCDTFNTGSDNTAAYVVTSLSDSDWVEIARGRGWVGGAKRVACEVLYYNTQTAGQSIKWKIESRDANDSAAADAADHYIAESAGTAHSPAEAWHTINGQLDGAGGNTKLLTIDGPTDETEPGDTTSWREFVLYAQTDGSPAVEMGISYWHVFEALTSGI